MVRRGDCDKYDGHFKSTNAHVSTETTPDHMQLAETRVQRQAHYFHYIPTA